MKMTRILKKYAACLVAAAILIPVMTGCGSKTDNTDKPVETTEVSESKEAEDATAVPEAKEEEKTEVTEQETGETGASYDFVVDYKTSEMYSEDDMNKAIDVILREFNTWEGCVMKELSYTDALSLRVLSTPLWRVETPGSRTTTMETGNGISEELMAGTGIF